jgi:DNA-binding NtrC family response regulator
LQDASPKVASEGSSQYQDVLNRGERQALEMLLRRHRGNVSRAAKDAKMTRQGLHKAMIRLGIKADQFRT